MNPTAIYSKSGKGVQEASGKTSHLSRADRAVLSAIDGKASVADVAQKIGKPLDATFEQLIGKLDKDGFIREVSAGVAPPAPASAAKPAKPTAKAAPAPAQAGEDLDFSSFAPPPPKPAEVAQAKDQTSSLNRARLEAEARAQKERERIKAEAEAKLRAEAEAKLRAQAAEKGKAELEAKLRAEAEAKAKADAERAKLEAERKAREEAERARKEAEEKAAREAEELRRKLEEERVRAEEERRSREEAERKAREEAERKAKEEIERARREAEEKARQEAEALRKQLEEERRKLEEERRRQDEERKRRDEEDKARRAAEQRARQEAEARARKEADERARREAEDQARREAEERSRAQAAAAQAQASAQPKGGISDSLLDDLDSFGKREEDERKAREEQEREAKEEGERQAKAEAERRAREEDERKRREEEEKKRKVQEAPAAVRGEAPAARAAAAARSDIDDMDDIGVTDDDLDLEDVKRDERALSASAKRAAKEREREEREAAQHAGEPAAPVRERLRIEWGKPVAITLFVLLAAGIGWIHVMPLGVAEYEAAATEALGAPVKIGSGRLSLFTGVQATFSDVTVGESKIGRVRAYPELGTLFGPKKVFSRIDIDAPVVRQEALGGLLFAKSKGERFQVGRIVASKATLEGPLALPPLDADIALGPDGAARSATLRGAEGLVAKLAQKDGAMEFEVSAAQFTLPIAPQVTLGNFGMKGTATREEMRIASWDGTTLDGNVAGSGVIRWGSTWQADGAFTVRGINAAVFAPALLSEGKAEGSGKFSLNGPEPAKLIDGGRIEGSFTINKGALGSVDLSRALQTGGRQASGRTPFTEMTGQGVYDKGMVQLRNVTIGAGALNAGASADINASGAISGRIVADVKTGSQTLRASFNLGGTVRDPQVKN